MIQHEEEEERKIIIKIVAMFIHPTCAMQPAGARTSLGPKKAYHVSCSS
jgi:hypothetical protein